MRKIFNFSSSASSKSKEKHSERTAERESQNPKHRAEKNSKKEDALKLPKLATGSDNYSPATISGSETTNTLPDGLTHEEKTEAINYMNKMSRCQTSKKETSVEVHSIRKGSKANDTSKVRLRYGWVSQTGYYPESINKPNQDNLLVHTTLSPFQITYNTNKTEEKGDIYQEELKLFCVFDGHGQYGTECSTFAAQTFVPIFNSCKEQLFNILAGKGDNTRIITVQEFQALLAQTLEIINLEMHKQKKNISQGQQPDENYFDDTFSGTTAICVLLLGDKLITANVGDSRAFLAVERDTQPGLYSARALSVDQTPFRKDERARCRAAGGVIMSMDQVEGFKKFDPNQEDWGTEDDLNSSIDPPRLWGPQPGSPGVAFTRSLGDEFVEKIGCVATPEISIISLPRRNRSFFVVASDGVFEFLNTEAVCEMVQQFSNPLDAAKALVTESYKLWLHYEVRTDDITAIVVFIDGVDGGTTSVSISPDIEKLNESFGQGVEQRPVRRIISKEKRKLMKPIETMSDDEDDDQYDQINIPEKNDEEKREICDSIQANFIFQHLTDTQLEQVLSSFERIIVEPNQVVIKQGEKGDKFYVVSSGVFDCFVSPVDENGQIKTELGNLVHTYESTETGLGNPSFGELALMYSDRRAASIIAKTNGVLWALDRKVFKKMFLKGSNQKIFKLLYKIPIFEPLTKSQVQRLTDVVFEQTFQPGERIIRQGDMGDALYIVTEGEVRCVVSNMEPLVPSDSNEKSPSAPITPHMNSGRRPSSKGRQFKFKRSVSQKDKEIEVLRVKVGEYFGERALLYKEPRAASVYVVEGSAEPCPAKCLVLNRASFEQLLGPLQDLIAKHGKKREEEALSRQILLKNRSKVGVGRFGLDFASFDAGSTSVVYADQAGELIYRQVKLHSSSKVVTIKCNNREAIERDKLQAKINLERKLLLQTVTETIDPFDRDKMDDEDELSSNFSFVARFLGTFVGVRSVYVAYQNNICGTLGTYVESNEVISEKTAGFIAACVVHGLQFLHERSILCRSINLHSLLLDESGSVVICDMYLCKVLDDETHRAYTMCGDPTYFAPEQIQNKGASFSIDFWALGILFYELLYSRFPYIAQDTPNEEIRNLSEKDIFTLIVKFSTEDILFDSKVSISGQSLVKALLEPNPSSRKQETLGIQEHPFFQDHMFNINKLEGFAQSPLFGWCESRLKEIFEQEKVRIDDNALQQGKNDQSWVTEFIEKPIEE
eukprot:maker-scaffold_41-snap-gene-1.33-mRNA-1 protein AED:0.27 eAED:0.27 QI:0/0/0/0.2/1/1/5/0/1230